MTVRVIEANVHGLTIGSHRPEADLDYLAILLVGLFYGVLIDDFQRHAREFIAPVVWGIGTIELGRERSAHPIRHR